MKPEDKNPKAAPDPKAKIPSKNTNAQSEMQPSRKLAADGPEGQRERPPLGPTGPRTPEGKERAKSNATKHGIFSKHAVLKGESEEEFQALLDGLRESLGPVGVLEELLVEKLTVDYWRLPRVLIAERGEIEANPLPVPPNFSLRSLTEHLKGSLREKVRKGLLDSVKAANLPPQPLIKDPAELDLVDALLRNMLAFITNHAIDSRFAAMLDQQVKEIYGTPGPADPGKAFCDLFASWAESNRIPEEQRRAAGLPSSSEKLASVVRELNREIKLPDQRKAARDTEEAERQKVKVLQDSIPDSAAVERLVRYRTAIERDIDRTLNQLERLRRRRLGLPVGPEINVYRR
jgi:hypothetical protein